MQLNDAIAREALLQIISREKERRRIDKEKDKPIDLHQWIKKVTPDYEWDTKHILYSCGYLQRILNGEHLKLIVTMPPRHGKTELFTKHFPACFLRRFPQKKVMLLSYNQDTSIDFSSHCKRIYTNSYEADGLSTNNIFSRDQAKHWITQHGGEFLSVSMSSGATGKGGHLVIIDDPITGWEDAYSKCYRDKVWNRYVNDISTRKEPDGTSFIIILTRWHTDDLVGRIKSNACEKDWIYIDFPAVANDNDLLGRAKGEVLWNKKGVGDIEYLNYRKEINEDGYYALYQQSPVISGGNIFKRAKYEFRSLKEYPKHFDYIVMALDGAWKTKQSNDYSAIMAMGLTAHDKKKYIIDMWRDRVEYAETKAMFSNLFFRNNVQLCLIEDASSGIPIIQEYAKGIVNAKGQIQQIPIKPIVAKTDKITRAHLASAINNIVIPTDHELSSDFQDEAFSFPKAPHDDLTDVFMMCSTELENMTSMFNSSLDC